MTRARRWPSRAGVRALAHLAVVAAASWLLPGCGPMPDKQAQARQVDALTARCAEAMARDVCVAERGASAVAAARPQGPVFVAGAGAVDERAYAEIRDAGDTMCRLVQAKCSDDWQGSACKTARSLWPAPAGSS